MVRYKYIVPAVLIGCLLLGGTALALSGKMFVRPAAIGVVDYDSLINQHPAALQANAAVLAENEQARQEFETRAPKLSDQEKQELRHMLLQRVEEKRREVITPVLDNINATIKTVADAKGLSVVVPKNATIYGGQDITEEVQKQHGGK